MRCVDVNVLVYAFRSDSLEHDAYRSRLDEWANDDEPLGLPDVVLSGVIRLVTNRRIFADPTPPDNAWSRVNDLLAAPASTLLRPGDHHWNHFVRLAGQIDAKANDLTDAYIAAFAVENNATLISADRGFRRFDGVRWQHPLS